MTDFSMAKRQTLQKDGELQSRYERDGRKKVVVILTCTIALLFLGIFFMTLGVKDTDMSQVCRAIYQGITGTLYDVEDNESAARKVVFLIRFRAAMSPAG